MVAVNCEVRIVLYGFDPADKIAGATRRFCIIKLALGEFTLSLEVDY